jgi:hypothetical protein
MLVQAPVGAWLSASIVDILGNHRSAGRLAGGHISFRLAGGANHAEQVPHLVEPGWQHLMPSAGLPEGKPVRRMLGEVPVPSNMTESYSKTAPHMTQS